MLAATKIEQYLYINYPSCRYRRSVPHSRKVRPVDLESVVDREGYIPVHYLKRETPMSAITALESYNLYTGDGGVSLYMTARMKGSNSMVTEADSSDLGGERVSLHACTASEPEVRVYLRCVYGI